MSQQVTQSVESDIVVLLTLDNVAVEGLVWGDLTAKYREEGEAAFTVKDLENNIAEIGEGIYTITFTAAELAIAGSFVVVVTGAGIDQSTTIVNVLAATETPTAASLEVCVINGHVFDATGSPVAGAAVSATVMGSPSIEQSSAALTGARVSVVTDASGEFFLTLVRLADVEITIPEANYRRRLVVPNQANANLYVIP